MWFLKRTPQGREPVWKIRSSEDPYLAGTISTCDTSGFFRIENYLAEDVKYVLFSETVPSKKNFNDILVVNQKLFFKAKLTLPNSKVFYDAHGLFFLPPHDFSNMQHTPNELAHDPEEEPLNQFK